MSKPTYTYEYIKNHINDKTTGNNSILLTTEEEFQKERFDKKLPPSKVKLRILCSVCKKEYVINFTSFQDSNKQCRECSIKNSNYIINRKMTFEKIKQYIESDEGNGCKLITSEDEYNNKIKEGIESKHIKLNIQCRCGHVYPVIINAFKNGQKQCPKCGEESRVSSRRKGYDDIKEYVESTFSQRTGIQYILLTGEYKNHNTRLDIIDNEGYKYQTTYKNMINSNTIKVNRLLPYHKSNPYTIENIKLWVSKNDNKYKLLSTEYKDAKTKLQWECPFGHKFDSDLDHFMQGGRCPQCEMSIGERKILLWLIENNIKHKPQYKFDDCRGKRNSMPFDFAIFNDDNSLKCLIEFDGEMHYEAHRFSNSKKAELDLRERQRRDRIKDEYCKKNNIPLIRIPYWEKENIKEILSNKLNTAS